MLKKRIKEINEVTIDPIPRKKLGQQLAILQRQLREANRSMIIVLDGFESSGRADIIRDLIRELDPRYFEVKTFSEANTQEKKYPFLRRFVHEFPSNGHITIFDRSFYYELFNDLKISKKTLINRIADLRFMEDLILNDNTILCKFFLVQSKDKMKKRVKSLHDNPMNHFFKDDHDKYQLEHFDEFLDHFDKVLQFSHNEACPWQIVVSDNIKEASRFVLMSVLNLMKISLETPIDTRELQLTPIYAKPVTNLDLSKTISDEDYETQIEKLQQEASDLLYQMYAKNKSGVIVFEGTDAAGKGGAIKRLTRLMDPRLYQVSTTAGPTKEELNHHYLWRFYLTLPMDGHITIYDRSWYGRVMVERLEKFTPLYRTQQAYQELNHFEASLVDEDRFVLKFLIHISKEEQHRRFIARRDDPAKQYKLTDEDWRNHEKYDAYLEVMDEMVNRTSTVQAPWIVISGTDKKYSRIQVLKHFIEAAKNILKK